MYINDKKELAPAQYTADGVKISNFDKSRDMCARYGFYYVADPEIPEGKVIDWTNSEFTLQQKEETRNVTKWKWIEPETDEDGVVVTEGHWESYTENQTFDVSDWAADWVFTDVPAVEVVHRYSTLKLHDAIGHDAWMAIVSALPEEQQTRLALAQELATDDEQFAAALETFKAQIPGAEEILKSAEV